MFSSRCEGEDVAQLLSYEYGYKKNPIYSIQLPEFIISENMKIYKIAESCTGIYGCESGPYARTKYFLYSDQNPSFKRVFYFVYLDIDPIHQPTFVERTPKQMETELKVKTILEVYNQEWYYYTFRYLNEDDEEWIAHFRIPEGSPYNNVYYKRKLPFDNMVFTQLGIERYTYKNKRARPLHKYDSVC